jgi:hypothetical protein
MACHGKPEPATSCAFPAFAYCVSPRQERVEDVVIEFGDERLAAPRRQLAAGVADALGGDPAAGRSGGLNTLVQQGRRPVGVAASQSSYREVGASDTALHPVALRRQGGQGAFEVIVSPLRATDVQLAHALEASQPIVVESAACWIGAVDSERGKT